MDNPLLFWGVWASPFQLKLQALADANGLPWRRLPAQGGRLENLAALTRITLESRGGNIPRFRGMDPALDEYPSVPFYSFEKCFEISETETPTSFSLNYFIKKSWSVLNRFCK